MIDRNAQLGWSEAQWNRVRQAVLEEWQRVRVAGNVLPVYGPLPPSTQVVPSELVKTDGSVDDGASARVVEIDAHIELSGQQVAEEDLSDAVLLFRRAATALARAEDQIIFNGQFVLSQGPPVKAGPTVKGGLIPPSVAMPLGRFPAVRRRTGEPGLDQQVPAHAAAYEKVFRSGLQSLNLAELTVEIPEFARVNPGSLGLVLCAAVSPASLALTGPVLVTSVAGAIANLQRGGYGKPFVCFVSENVFVKAHEPTGDALVLPTDRITPLLDRELERSPALDIPPAEGNNIPRGRCVLMSLAGDPVDLVVSLEATPQFIQVNEQGKYVFRIVERFALRVKDFNAIALLDFAASTAKPPAAAGGPDWDTLYQRLERIGTHLGTIANKLQPRTE